MQANWKEQLKEINLNDDIVIFDVDRTIINTTSWYQACICEDLLISKENVQIFKKLNQKAFEVPDEIKMKKFREDTLNIIDKRITSKFIDKIENMSQMTTYFTSGDSVNEIKFYVAGVYTSNNLVEIYNDWVNYVKFLMRYYGPTLKVIFLTSGYEPFIRGVVDGIIEKSGISKLRYKIIGSKLEFTKNSIKEIFHMSQQQKEDFVSELIKNDRKIKFLADDSNENMKLFKTVELNGGIALNIKHIPHKKENTTWKNYMKTFTKERIKKQLMSDISSKTSLNEKRIELPNLLQVIEENTDSIGIAYLNISEFEKALKNLKKIIRDINHKNAFEDNIKKLIFIKNDTVYLRGNLYYNWLPAYIFLDNRTINEKWKEQIKICLKLLEIIEKENILKKDISENEYILIYCIIDNLLEACLYLLNLIELNELKGNKILSKHHRNATKLAKEVTEMMYKFFLKKEDINITVAKVISIMKELEIIKTIPNGIKYYKTMRELDNNITIFKTVKMIADNLQYNYIDYIIAFPYGGIALGFALNAYLKIALNKKNVPKLMHSHYSSKQKIREQTMEKDMDFSLFKYIPKKYKKYVQEIKKGNKSILLLDNNVTTFKTLDISKSFLTQIGNKVYAGISAVNYDNIVNYLLGEKSEILVSNWRKVIDFNPVEEYVTAFNTWKTSQKTEMLEHIYLNENEMSEIKTGKFSQLQRKEFIFKLCRIQNVQDLNTAIINGVNMIGIHAVYPDRIKYLKNEIKYSPINTSVNVDSNLPIGTLELNAIRDIQNYIPKNLKQAILFERELPIKNMIDTCKMYNIKNDIYIQLQHRTEKTYIEKVKKEVSNNLIITIGLFQSDFQEYFWYIHNLLDPNTDYILIDMSKHQPDLISYSDEYRDSINKLSVITALASVMKYNKVPIIIADDTTPETMEKYLKILSEYGIKIAGVDMQNSVEYMPNEQKYQMVKCQQKQYVIKVRKSSDKLALWNEVLDRTFENIQNK